LFDRFREHYARLLYTLGVSREDMRRELLATGDVTVTKTVDRRVLGSLNQLAKDLPMIRHGREPLVVAARDDLEIELAFLIDHSLEDVLPVTAARARFDLPPPGDIETVEPPAGSIRVDNVHDDEWEFAFPRVTPEIIEAFPMILERLRDGFKRQPQLLLERIVREHPEHLDAIAVLATIDDRAGRAATLRLLRHAVDVGQRALPGKFRMGRDCLPWSLIGNRPYLRARAALAMALLRSGLLEEAEAASVELLALNPEDNQGFRQILADVRLRMGNDAGVLEICDAFAFDTSESLLYGRVLALYRMGRRDDAREALSHAMATLPLVGQELARATHVPPATMHHDYVTAGGADQAFQYWVRAGEVWLQTAGAIEFVAAFIAAQRAELAAGAGTKKPRKVTPLHEPLAVEPPLGEFLSDDQVEELATRMAGTLLENQLGVRHNAAKEYAEGSVRYRQVGERLQQAREARGLALKEVAGKLKVQQYRLRATEDWFPRRIDARVFWRYCDFLELRGFALRWIEANPAMAERIGIAPPLD
jgi:tetratricopeptide (TPR) repeat protein